MNALFADQQLWHIAGWTMLHYLWLGALVGAMAIIARMLLRRAVPNLRYASALACLFLLAALPIGIAALLASHPQPLKGEVTLQNPPPLKGGVRGGISDPVATTELNSPNPDSPIATHPNEIIDRTERYESQARVESDAEREIKSTAPTNTEPSPSPSLKGSGISFAALETCIPYLPWVWLVGTPITFALLAAGIIGTKRLRSASRVTDDPRIADALSRLSSSLRIGKRISIAICDRIASPVLVGIVRPIILLPPAAITGWSPDEIEMVLLHELAHVRRWDNLVNLIQRLIESLFFFHPAVWLVSTWVRRERESCCDAFVVRRTERPHAYAELLLNLATASPQPLAGLAFAQHPLRTRIRRILQLDDDPMLISGKSLAITLSSLIVAATLTVLYLPAIGQAEGSATEVTESTQKDPAKEHVKISNQENVTKPEVVSQESDRILVAYEIPTDLADETERFPEVRGQWDDRGRFVIQATREWHVQFEALLKATPKWRDSAAARERTAKPIKLIQVDGKTRFEWRSMGLTFGEETRPSVLSQMNPDGVKVIEVAPGSPAAWHDVRPGDNLYGIEGFGTGTLAELESVLKTLLEGFTNESRVVELKSLRPLPNNSLASIPIRMLLHPDDPNSPKSAQGPMAQEQLMRMMQMQQASNRQAKPQTKSSPAHSLADVPTHEPPPPEAEDAEPPKPRTAPTRPKKSPAQSKSNLRYDGKTFDDWRNAGQTELSTQKRLEAVKAIAAFGPRGYGREAAESILEVAGEYEDWSRGKDGTVETQLREAVVNGLAEHIPASAWLSPLRQRFDTNPKRWQWLAIRTLRELKPANDDEKNEAQSFLFALTQSDVDAISSYAVSALVKLDPALRNERIKNLAMERLNSDNPDVVQAIMSELVRTPQFPPETIDLLLHGDMKRQHLLRNCFDRNTEWKANLALADSMTALLKDKTNAADHLAAIRTLAAMGPVARKAESDPVDVLQSIVTQGNAEHQIAAASAIGQITNGHIGAAPLLTGRLLNSDGVALDAFAIQTLLESERKAVFGDQRQ